MSVGQFFLRGGPVMWLILICSLTSAAVIINRFKYFSLIPANEYLLKSKIFELIKQNKIKDALVLCEKTQTPASRILKAGIVCFGRQGALIKEAVETAGHLEIALMERNLMGLSTITHLAPLLGLLGTMLGLANSFFIIQSRALALNPVTPGDIAGGIWQAILTTIFGLIVSVPSLLFYNYFVYRIDGFVSQYEQMTMEFLNLASYSAEAQS